MKPKWLEWATRLQPVAQAGITFSKDRYDLERFEQIRMRFEARKQRMSKPLSDQKIILT